MPSFQVPVLGFADGFLSPFPDSLPQLFLRCLPCAFAFGLSPSVPLPFVPFSSGSGYSAFCSSFPSLPGSASQWLLQCTSSAFASLVFPFLSDLVSHVFFPGSSYSASCSFPFIPPGFAPTAVPPVLPLRSRFRAFSSLPLPFVRFRLVLTTQLSVLSFPFFPFSPDGGSSGASFLFCPACFHAFLPIPVLSFLHFLSPFTVSPHSSYLSASAFSLSVPGLFPLAFALGSGYLAFGIYPSLILPCCFISIIFRSNV